MELCKEQVRIDGGKNYWCSWSSQWSIGKNQLAEEGSKSGYFEGDCSAYARAAICEEMVFGQGGFAEQFPEIRGDLFLLFDDGWDVPLDVSTEQDISAFGSVIPNEERFPSFPGTPAERLKGINIRLQERGWKGLGLWISPTMTGKDFDVKFDINREMHEEYWKQRVLWCKEADVRYWKVDWGSFGGGDIVEYREMISRIGTQYFPELIIEQTTCSAPYNGIPSDGKIRYTDNIFTVTTGKKVCEFCDVYRSYDVTDDMLADTTTLDRLNYYLSFAPCVINCEDALYTGAVLGCALGIMRNHYGKDWLRMNRRLDEVNAAVKWQRFAPSFAGGALKTSDDLLRDSMFFGATDTWCQEIKNRFVEQTAPAVMARNTELPLVERSEKMPFVIACMNPTGVYALGAIRRREFLFDTQAPVVSCEAGAAERIGIFGNFEQVKLHFDHKPVRMYVQNLIRGEEQAVDMSKYLSGTTVILTQALLDEFNEVKDESDNAVMFRFEFLI